MNVFLAVVLILAFVPLGVTVALWTDRGRKDEALQVLDAQARRQERALRSMVTPLAWIVQGTSPQEGRLDAHRLRSAAVSAFTMVQGGLGAEDQVMAELIAQVPEPPRRMPKYPLVPPYLATPEDIAQVPSMPRVSTEPIEYEKVTGFHGEPALVTRVADDEAVDSAVPVIGLESGPVDACPACGQEGQYDGRVLLDGRGVYTCPSGHRWQNLDEKPTNKGTTIQ